MKKLELDPQPTANQIVDICGVTKRTAYRWLSGESEMPKPLRRLVELELSGRILPVKWPAHWRFNARGLFETESCHPAINWQQLTWYKYVIQGWHRSLDSLPKIEASINYLMDKLPKAELIVLEEYRQKLDELTRLRDMTPEKAARLAFADTPRQEKLLQRQHGC